MRQRARPWLGSLAALTVLSLPSACGSTSWQSALADARAAPLHVQAELALIAGGDAARAANLAEQALRASPPGSDGEARAFLALVVASDALGDFERPLPFLARVLAAGSDPRIAARLAGEAGRAWARLDGHNAASPDVRAALLQLAERAAPGCTSADPECARAGEEWEAARARALRELITAERLRAGPEAGRKAAAEAGFVLDWRLSAPWGDAPALDFTRPLGPETRALAERETTGAGWDLIPVTTSRQLFSDGEVTFFDLPATGAVGFAQASLTAPADGRHLVLRLESNRLLAVFIDGLAVMAREESTAPWLRVAHVALPAGVHRLTVKLASSDGRGFFRLQVSDLPRAGRAPPTTLRVEPLPAPALLAAPRPGDARGAVLALHDLEDRLSRPNWDPDGARDRARALEASFGPHTSLDLLAARLALGDSAAPPAERRQTARARFEAVLARTPGHPAARRGLARIERDEERPDRALALLRADEAGTTADVRTQLDLLDLYRERGWESEALATAGALAPLAHASPRLQQELIDLYKAFGRVGLATELALALEQGFPGAGRDRVYGLALDRGRADPAQQLQAWAWEPQRHALLRSAVAGMRLDLGDRFEEVDRLLRGFLDQRANDGWALGERVRLALQAGHTGDAADRIREALDVLPDFAPMEQLLHQLEHTPEPFDTLEDGRAVLARWLAFKGTADGAAWAASPIISVLERTRVAVRKDGSTLELSHRVRLVQTKQGIDDVGDVRPPDGARLLVARTLKADGRVLEPERTQGKAELSFPELEPGDAVETAWVSRSRVAPSEGGYLTGVSFASWGTPIFELDVSVEADSGLDLVAKRFGGAPEPVTTRDAAGAVALRWQARRLPPVAKEPLGLSARSFFPFADIRVTRADIVPAQRNAVAWNRIARAYAARLTTLGQPGPRLAALAARLARAQSPAQAAFEWVKTEVTDQEQLNTFETPVEAVIANRKGNRALVLWALLDAMRGGSARDSGRVGSELLLCAPERDGPPEDRADPTPNPNRFFYPIVAGPGGEYFDPARPYTPPGDLPAELGNAGCLSPLRSQDAASFVELPSRASDPSFEATLFLTLDADGDAHGVLTGRAQGAAASPLRQAFLAQDEERQRILFEQWLASLAVGARLVDYQVEHAAAAEQAMRWELSIELPAYASREGDMLVVQRPLKPLVHADFAGVTELAQLVSAPTRLTPLRLLPFSERVILELVAPPGMKLAAPPPDIALRGIDQSSIVSGDTLRVTRRIELRPGRVSPAEYDAFRRDVGVAIRALETSLRFAPGAR